MSLKKYLAAILVLVLIMSMATTTFAAPTPTGGQSSIEFDHIIGVSDAHDGIFCIDAIPAPTHAMLTASAPQLFTAGIEPVGFNFGVRPQAQAAQIFRTLDTVASSAAGAPALTPNRSGIVILTSRRDWEVSVSISGFTTATTTLPTLQGFELTIAPHNGPISGAGNAAPFVRGPAPTVPADFELETVVLEALGSGGTPVPIAESIRTGLFASNFAGSLSLPVPSPASERHQGVAQAVMTWSISNVGTP